MDYRRKELPIKAKKIKGSELENYKLPTDIAEIEFWQNCENPTVGTLLTKIFQKNLIRPSLFHLFIVKLSPILSMEVKAECLDENDKSASDDKLCRLNLQSFQEDKKVWAKACEEAIKSLLYLNLPEKINTTILKELFDSYSEVSEQRLALLAYVIYSININS